jgi:hypothetical protein
MLIMVAVGFGVAEPAQADDKTPANRVDAQTTTGAVRITLIRLGGEEQVLGASGGSTEQSTCNWTSVRAESTGLGDIIQVPSDVGAQEQAALYNLFCNGDYYGAVWVGPADIVDVDAAIRAEAERYVRDVLTPAVSIGVTPNGAGLAGLRSWFWIEGFDGTVTAPPISAFGMTVDVRMTTAGVRWDFGDGTRVDGDLGRAYPEESTVQHAHQSDGTYTITAEIGLAPEYSVNGGPWLTLPNLRAIATSTHPVEQRQPVITDR